MWLLDVNMPVKLISFLKAHGIDADTTHNRGWDALSNGVLVEAASKAGFVALLTRDRLFAESASRALKRFSHFSVIVVTLPQAGIKSYIASFEREWALEALSPQPGREIIWPS
jgi:hypothetical protein